MKVSFGIAPNDRHIIILSKVQMTSHNHHHHHHAAREIISRWHMAWNGASPTGTGWTKIANDSVDDGGSNVLVAGSLVAPPD